MLIISLFRFEFNFINSRQLVEIFLYNGVNYNRTRPTNLPQIYCFMILQIMLKILFEKIFCCIFFVYALKGS